MAREYFRKLIDKQGNVYAISIPADVDPEDITDVMVGIHEGIVKLQGYQLAGDVWRLPDNVECPAGGKEFTFYKKVDIFTVHPEISQEDFGNAIREMLERARNFKINRAEIKSYEGKPVLKDNRGYFVKREFPCVAEGCSNKIDGVQRLSTRDGQISRAQAFEPTDPAATRVRAGSKSWFCPSCSPKSVPVPESNAPTVEQTTQPELPELPCEPVKKSVQVVTKVEPDADLQELLRLSDWQSDVPLEWLKGYVQGVIRARLGRVTL